MGCGVQLVKSSVTNVEDVTQAVKGVFTLKGRHPDVHDPSQSRFPKMTDIWLHLKVPGNLKPPHRDRGR